MGIPPDEHLPEVVPGNDPQTVPDGSPQALTAQEAYARQQYFDSGAKYSSPDGEGPTSAANPHVLDPTFRDRNQAQYAESGVPWDTPMSRAGMTAGLHAGSVPIGSSQLGSEDEKGPAGRDERICGLTTRIFYLVMGACIIVVSVVVGVGVGVSLASQQQKASGETKTPDSGQVDSTPGSTAPLLPPLPQPTNTVPSVKLNETRLNGRFKFQGWSGVNFTGESTEVIQGLGITQFDFSIRSYVWDPDGYTCCVSFCNQTVSSRGAYWCQVLRQPRSSGPFDRIVTICGGNEITKQATSCS